MNSFQKGTTTEFKNDGLNESLIESMIKRTVDEQIRLQPNLFLYNFSTGDCDTLYEKAEAFLQAHKCMLCHWRLGSVRRDLDLFVRLYLPELPIPRIPAPFKNFLAATAGDDDQQTTDRMYKMHLDDAVRAGDQKMQSAVYHGYRKHHPAYSAASPWMKELHAANVFDADTSRDGQSNEVQRCIETEVATQQSSQLAADQRTAMLAEIQKARQVAEEVLLQQRELQEEISSVSNQQEQRNAQTEMPVPPPIGRAQWLQTRLKERGWNKHDVGRHDGPDHKTVQKILNSQKVRPDVLEKLARALSKKGSLITPEDIPTEL